MGVVGRLNQQIFEVISNYLSINLSSWLNCLLMWSEANYLTLLGFYHTILFLQMKQIIASGGNDWQSLKEKISFHCTWKRKKKKKKQGFLFRTMTPLQESDWIWDHNMSPGLTEILEVADHKQTSSCKWRICASGNSKVLIQKAKSFPRVRRTQEEWLIPLLNLEVDSQRPGHFWLNITYKSPLYNLIPA